MSDPDAVLKRIRDEEIPYVDLRFTDTAGKWQHLTLAARMVDEDTFVDGVMFGRLVDRRWKAINESDMTLMPDAGSVAMDPFESQPTLIVNCDILEPSTGQPYGRDPRSTAKARRDLSPVHGHRRCRLFRAGARVLHLRQRALLDRGSSHLLPARRRGRPLQ